MRAVRSYPVILATCCLAAWSARAELSGWRSDGTGRYPDAQPPTSWAKDKHIVWATPMPAWSNATPVLVGDKLISCAEPATLLCVSLADGKILWQKANTYEEVLSPEEQAKAKEAIEKSLPIEKEINELSQKLRRAQAALKPKPAEPKAKKEGEAEAKKPEGGADPAQAPDAEAEAKRVEAEAEAKKNVADLTAKIAELKKQLDPFMSYKLPSTHGTTGYSSATPLTDGKHIWAAFGNSIVVCYDMEGNRKWAKRLEKPAHEWGFCASPVLAAGKLFIHLAKLTALDPATGEQAWSVALPFSWGSPIPVKIGADEYLFTAAGDIVRPSDGKALASKLCKLDFCAPITQDGIVYYIQNGGKAIKLPAEASEGMKPETLWQTKIKSDRYYASPVLHDGLIYAALLNGFLSVIDAKTGTLVYEKDLALGKGTVYPSISLGGKNLYISNDSGVTVVVEAGKEFKEVARNTLEGFRGSLVFAGNKLYLRGQQKLYCIAAPAQP